MKKLAVLALIAVLASCSSSGGSSSGDVKNDLGGGETGGTTDGVDSDDPDAGEDIGGDAGFEATGESTVPVDVADAGDLGGDGSTTDAGDVPDLGSGDGGGPDGSDAGEDIGPLPDVEETVEPPPETFFKSAELGIKILGPSSTGKAQALGASIQIAGLVAGKPDAIMWESATTGQSGYAEGMPFFLTGKVDLEQGDNVVTVSAMQGDDKASETIVITYNPAFLFGGVIVVRPGAAFVGTKSTMCFNLDMSLYANFEPNTLKLCESTEDGECVSDVGKMSDDGQVNSTCDEVGEDGVYSFKKDYTVGQPGKLCFRAHVAVKAGYQQYTAFTPVTCVDVVQHVTKETCEAVNAIQAEAKQLYETTLATSDPGTARQAVVSFLQKNPDVAEVGTSFQGFGVWVRYASGLLGAFDFNLDGMRGGQEEGAGEYEQAAEPIGGMQEILVASKRAAVFSPSNAELGELDEGKFANNLMKKSECPAFVLDGPYNNEQAKLAKYRSMRDYGVIALTGHGDTYFKLMSEDAKKAFDWTHMKSQELVWTGEPVDCSKLVQTTPTCTGPGTCPDGSDCEITESAVQGVSLSGTCIDWKQVDLRRGRIVMGADRYGFLPSFVKYYRGRGYPESLVYLGTCRSLWNGTLGMEFYGAGAKAVVGYDGYVSSQFAYEQGTAFFSALLEEMKLTGEALPVGTEDPQNPGTTIRLLGAPNLNVTNADLINPSFETGELTGWQKSGDGRVVSRLGITVPVEGKFMGLISTGMGFTPQVGEIFQTFCIPEDKMEASFYWKFYSEEFKEWCGSIFQDTFEATLESDEGVITLVSVNVDALCPPEECGGCGGSYDGLIQSDVIFDQGGVWNTHWRKATSNVMALAGTGAVTMRFFCTDMGDSIYDTVVLIDTIKFK
jgi:hypothetical protein